MSVFPTNLRGFSLFGQSGRCPLFVAAARVEADLVRSRTRALAGPCARARALPSPCAPSFPVCAPGSPEPADALTFPGFACQPTSLSAGRPVCEARAAMHLCTPLLRHTPQPARLPICVPVRACATVHYCLTYGFDCVWSLLAHVSCQEFHCALSFLN